MHNKLIEQWVNSLQQLKYSYQCAVKDNEAVALKLFIAS